MAYLLQSMNKTKIEESKNKKESKNKFVQLETGVNEKKPCSHARTANKENHWGQLYINLNYSCTRTIIMPDVQPSQTFYLNSRSK